MLPSDRPFQKRKTMDDFASEEFRKSEEKEKEKAKELNPKKEDTFLTLLSSFYQEAKSLEKKREKLLEEGSKSKERFGLLRAYQEEQKWKDGESLLFDAATNLEKRTGEKINLQAPAVRLKKKKKPLTPEKKIAEKIKRKFQEKRKKLKAQARKEKDSIDLEKSLKELKTEEQKVLLREKNKAILSFQTSEVSKKK